MMIKVNGLYLDFNADIEIERRIKLFQEIETSDGDLSFSFDLYLSSKNLTILGIPIPDSISKTVYTIQETVIEDDNGMFINIGSIRIEKVVDNVASCSFFGGNSNWFGLLAGPLTDVDFSEFDTDQTIDIVESSRTNTEGVAWPLVDAGALSTRSNYQVLIEDFIPSIFVHTVVNKIFQHHSIKIQGDLLKDADYKKFTTLRNVKSQVEIDAYTSYVEKTSTTTRISMDTDYKVTFDNDSVFPYYDGSGNPFDISGSTWTAPYKMKIKIEVSFVPEFTSGYSNVIRIYINGVYTYVDIGLDSGAGLYNSRTGAHSPFTIERNISLEAGDVIEIYSQWHKPLGPPTPNPILSGWLKITPLYIYYIKGSSIVPPWSQKDYISNVFRIFNVLPSYDQFTKTLTLDLFDNIKTKQAIDISEAIDSMEVDYQEFISNYGKRNLLSYKEVDFDDLREYNIQEFFKYGQGSINVDNDFLPASESIVESAFSNPIGYIHPVLDMSIERLNIIEMEESDQVDITAVSDNGGGIARFSISSNFFIVGDMIRIAESTYQPYNGDWVINVVGSGYVEVDGADFDDSITSVTGKMTKITHRYNEVDDVYLLYHVANYPVNQLSGNSFVRYGSVDDQDNIAFAYFSLLFTGRQVNEDFKQSLSFGEIESPFFYQRTLIEKYWNVFSRVVNDPVMLRANIYLDWKTHNEIDFLRPISIKSLDTSNIYYLNRETGYKGSNEPCEVELIKLP